MFVVADSYRRHRRRVRRTVIAVSAALMLSGCQARPGDAPIAEEPTTTEAAPTAAPDQSARTITIGVSEFSPGFNPHLISTDPAFANIIADLVLPSAFRQDANGEWQMDADLLAAVEPSTTETGAQKVRYRIRPEAQWSDGTPVSGSDFEYLWQSMLQTSGVRDAIGYEAIKSLQVSGGGRIVDVTFTNSFPNWRTLFRNLLPSHIYRGAGTAFTDAMNDSIPVSGGRYTVQSLDLGRNDLELVRNDRFSGANPAATEILHFREVTSDQQGAELLRTGQAQLAQVRPQEVTDIALGGVPGVTTQLTSPPTQLQLDFNLTSTQLTDAAARTKVAKQIDVTKVAQVVTGKVKPPLPKQPEQGAEQASTDKTSAEPTSTRETSSSSSSSAAFEQNTRPLRIGFPQGDNRAGAAASTIADQLTNAKIDAEAVPINRRELFAGHLPTGTIDMVVTWRGQADSVTSLVSQYLCTSHTRAAIEVEPPTSVSDAAKSTATTSQEPSSSTSTSSRTAEPTTKAAETFGRGSNASGLCSPDVDKLLLGALRTQTDSTELQQELQPLLAKEMITVPLVADQWLTATTAGLVSGTEKDPKKWPQNAQTGLFVTAPAWKRTTDG